ncbi:NACHT domain-containing protein [Thomasclavelia cocleata]|uniref:NACHT domain-containing protein n=1 Tax=Thomasclavelia cocleata TaxID=69824 RepID=UPI00242D73C6|nr:hypothetical protein [Thomasclavelia cocleata]
MEYKVLLDLLTDVNLIEVVDAINEMVNNGSINIAAKIFVRSVIQYLKKKEETKNDFIGYLKFTINDIINAEYEKGEKVKNIELSNFTKSIYKKFIKEFEIGTADFDLYSSVMKLSDWLVKEYKIKKDFSEEIITSIYIALMDCDDSGIDWDSRFVSYKNLLVKKDNSIYFNYNLGNEYIKQNFKDVDNNKISYNELKEIIFLSKNIINIYGEGGIGKTNLLFQLWQDVLDDYPMILPIYIDVSKDNEDIKNIAERDYNISLKSYEKSYKEIILLIDGQDSISQKDKMYIESSINNYRNSITKIIVTSRNKMNFQELNIGQNNYECRKYKILELEKEVIKNYLPTNISYSDDLLEILKIPIYLTMYKKSLENKLLEYASSDDNTIDQYYYKKIEDRAQILWNYNKFQFDKRGKDKEIILNIIPYIGYCFTKVDEKEILRKKIMMFIKNYKLISTVIDMYCKIVDTKDENDFNFIMTLNSVNEDLVASDETVKKILDIILETGIIQEIRASKAENNRYYFVHDYLKEFFAACNLLNNDFYYCTYGRDFFLFYSKENNPMRELDVGSETTKFYIGLFNNDVIGILKEEAGYKKYIGNVLGDYYCYEFYGLEKSVKLTSSEKLNEYTKNKNQFEKGLKSYCDDDFGVWSKAYFYTTLASINTEEVDKEINIKKALKLIHKCIFDIEDNENFLFYDDLKKLLDESNRNYPVPKVFNLLGKLYRNYDDTKSENYLEKIKMIYTKGVDLKVSYCANVLGNLYEEEAFKVIYNEVKKDEWVVYRLCIYLMNMGSSDRWFKNIVDDEDKERAINEYKALNIEKNRVNEIRVEKLLYVKIKLKNLINIDKLKLKEAIDICRQKLIQEIGDIVDFPKAECIDGKTEEYSSDILENEKSAFDLFNKSRLLGDRWAIRKLCEYLIELDFNNNLYNLIEDLKPDNKYEWALEKLETIKKSGVQGIQDWIERCGAKMKKGGDIIE